MSEHTLLLVDDEQNILSAISRVLRRENYSIVTFTDPKEALRELNRIPIAVAISDYNMPSMKGTEFLAHLKDVSPNTIRMILTGFADISTAMEAINRGEVYRFISKPWNDEDLKVTIRRAVEQYTLVIENKRLNELTKKQNAELSDLNKHLEQKVEIRTKIINEQKNQLENLYKTLEKNFYDSVKVFIGLLEMHDSSLGAHSKRVAELARGTAAKLYLPQNEIDDVELAGLLHDVGTIGIPVNLLHAQEESLTEEQRNLVYQHPILSQASIQYIEKLKDVGVYIRHHHERFDGSGYPEKLRGNEIPIPSRILGLVDYFDEMINQGKGGGKTYPNALEDIKRLSGSKFDIPVVKAFLNVLDELNRTTVKEEKVSISELNEEMILSRNIETADGVLLLAKNQMINRILMIKLKNFYNASLINDGIMIYERKE